MKHYEYNLARWHDGSTLSVMNEYGTFDNLVDAIKAFDELRSDMLNDGKIVDDEDKFQFSRDVINYALISFDDFGGYTGIVRRDEAI